MKRSLPYLALASLPWIALFLFIGWLFLLRFPLSGTISLSVPFDGRSPWMNAFLPGERVTRPGFQADGWSGQRIFQDPVYASALVPGAFDELEMEVEARFVRQPLLEIGHSMQDTHSFELEPVWSEVLSRGWKQVSMGVVKGFVRQDLPDRELIEAPTDRTLVWHATRPTDALMDPLGSEKYYERSLRGAHDFYFIPTEGEVLLRLSLQDVNRSRRGGNTVAFRLTQEDEVIWTDAMNLSTRLDDHPGKVYEKTIQLRHLKPGVYRLSVMADDDIFIRRFRTTARHWVIGPRLYFGDTAGYLPSNGPAVVWTNSQHLLLETRHQEGLQTVSFGRASVELKRTHEIVGLDRLSSERQGQVQVQAPRGDIRLLGDGFFSFDPSALFLPTPRRLTDLTDADKEGIHSIITAYQPPDTLPDGWKRLHLRFPLEKGKDTLYFVLSAPGILSRQGAVDVRAVHLTYRRTPIQRHEWWAYVRRELAQAWQRL